MMRRLYLPLAALGAASLLLAGCGSADDVAASDASSPAPGQGATSEQGQDVAGELTVFAAASLTEVFTALGTRFEEFNPSASITFNFGPSSSLATQIIEGAPADVFAAASTSTMDAVVDAGEAESPAVFARNVLEIAVPPDNPANITALADLARPGVKVALCQPDVPCGAVAATVFAAAGITVTPVTLEADVKAALAKVRLGEVDAGVVYVTDVLAAGDEVTGIEIPADVNASTQYPIAALTAARNPELAAAFVDFVLTSDGASALEAAGFERP